MTTPVASFSQIGKCYPGGWLSKRSVWALRDVSLQVERGAIFGLLGPNRAGKTTLVKILLSLCHATTGEVIRMGRPSSDRTTLATIGYVHESQAFPRYFTAEHLLEFYAALNHETGPAVRRRAQAFARALRTGRPQPRADCRLQQRHAAAIGFGPIAHQRSSIVGARRTLRRHGSNGPRAAAPDAPGTSPLWTNCHPGFALAGGRGTFVRPRGGVTVWPGCVQRATRGTDGITGCRAATVVGRSSATDL